ncbi:hypothetical protein G7047_19075 [Diaphorobacter sp. HDW4A]|uniref:hypothetical protein n=1 Tax=Diaphorobacter sp. HDW4A TaxID=2714924 RepID=UPI00140A3459|nr:hypothetical protein [Diaphorobacter sp. HDW4A]QIL81783.1 hypothetical protein G7047_19075 [Diaphorobacter sp. HDW4A]
MAETIELNLQLQPSLALRVLRPTARLHADMANVIAGPKGDPGDGGGVQSIALPAGEALGGHRVVFARDGFAFHASRDDVFHANAVLGITTGSASAGSAANVQTAGVIVESSWAWLASKPIFLGLNGVLTQSPPTTGVSLVIGVPTASDSMLINVQMPINL